MNTYTTLMTAYGVSAGINFKFHGQIANTLNAHRIIQHYQDLLGPTVASKIVDSLYYQYFEQEAHPSSPATLLAATMAAGIDEADALKVIGDESEGLMDVKMRIREQAGNGVDSVPFIVFEGKRRDFTFEGAREVVDYRKGLESVIKECA